MRLGIILYYKQANYAEIAHRVTLRETRRAGRNNAVRERL